MDTHTSNIKNIVELLIDSQKGYKEAAERAEAPHLKQLLMKLGTERSSLINELTSQLRMLGENDVPADGTLKGTLHRAWIDLRDSLSASDNANVLDECERGENYLLSRYDEILNDADLAPGVRSALSAQRMKVQANINEIQALHATHAASEKNK